MLGIGLSLTGRLKSSVFSPVFLFRTNEPGVWYDPSDLTTLFQDTAGTTPVTTPGQTVALALDKSRGLVLGPELVTNGDFSNGTTGWVFSANWSLSSGSAVSNGAAGDLYQSGFTANVTYRVTFTVTAYTSGNLAVRGGAGFQAYGVGTHTLLFRDAGGLLVFQSANYNGTIDNISVRELPGNHATQATAASRPTYGIVPRTGRRNLLTFSEAFDNAAWTKEGVSVTANNALAPDGTLTADLLTGTGATPRVFQTVTPLTSGISYTASCYVKPGTTTSIGFDAINIQAGPVFTFSTKTWSALSGQITAAGFDELADGWFRLRVTFTANTTNFGPGWYVSGLTTSLIWGAQLEIGSTATAYQRVVSGFDVTEAGVQSLSYLSFDGIDDFLVTPTITPGIDKAQVFAGVRKLSDAAIGAVLETSDNSNNNNGAIWLLAPGSPGSNQYSFRSKGTASSDTNVTGYTAPITNVITGIGGIADDASIIRVNGAQVGSSAVDQGTGNYLAYPLYIGRRGGTSLPFNGRLYGLVVRFGPNLDAATIAATEAWMNSKTGAY